MQDIATYMERYDSVVVRNARRLGIEFDLQKSPFSPEDDEAIRINFPHFPTYLVAYVIGRTPSSVSQRAARLGLEKASDFWTKPIAKLWVGGEHPNAVASRFKPGQVPRNKGVRRPGWAPGRMASTQFKKGRRPEESRNYQPVGTVRITRDGIAERKVSDDTNVYPAKRWVAVHRLVWEAAHGPVPAGHLVRFKEGMRTAEVALITLDRIEMISMAENMARNTIHNYPEEIVQAVRLRAVLKRTINRRARSAQP